MARKKEKPKPEPEPEKSYHTAKAEPRWWGDPRCPEDCPGPHIRYVKDI